MFACVRAHAQIGPGSELGVGLHHLRLGVNVCGIVSYTMRRFLANMGAGTDMDPLVPKNVFALVSDDILGTLLRQRYETLRAELGH